MIDSEWRDEWIVAEPEAGYWSKNDFLFQDETRTIIGICMEIHRILGKGFSEVVYKDALQWELEQRQILFEREKQYKVHYKEIVLKRSYAADFVVFDKIIVEVKAQEGMAEANASQVINYLAVSKCPVGLLINFGENSLKFKRFALTKNYN